MRLEDLDGWPWRSPELAARALERKYACAFASRGAGVVEWAWNINPFMPIDNESVIGFFRPDGTAKPELDVVPAYAEFFRTAAAWLDDFEPDPVIVVIPHSRLFMGRPAASDGVRRMIGLMAERFGVVPTALSELRLTPERLRDAKLVIVPSPEFLAGPAADALLAASRERDEDPPDGRRHGRPLRRDAGGAFLARNRRPRSPRGAEGAGWIRLRDVRPEPAGVVASKPRSPARSSLTGNVWHEPLPLEHAREDEPLASLLARAFAAAGVEAHPSEGGVAARLLLAPRAVFGVFVNETARDAERAVTIAGHAVRVSVPAGRARLLLFDRKSGEVIAETR